MPITTKQMESKGRTFTINNPRHLELLDSIAVEIGGDRQAALDRVLNIAEIDRDMFPESTDRDDIDDWEPSNDELGGFLP